MVVIKKMMQVPYMTATAAIMSLATASAALSWQSNTYTVREDKGGRIIDYAIMLSRMVRDGRAIRFDGRCDSACTLFLALPASRACVTPRAHFGFHLPYGNLPKDNRGAASFLLNSYPGWVRNWLQAKGGLTNQVKVMPYEFARRHLEDCTTDTTP